MRAMRKLERLSSSTPREVYPSLLKWSQVSARVHVHGHVHVHVHVHVLKWSQVSARILGRHSAWACEEADEYSILVLYTRARPCTLRWHRLAADRALTAQLLLAVLAVAPVHTSGPGAGACGPPSARCGVRWPWGTAALPGWTEWTQRQCG